MKKTVFALVFIVSLSLIASCGAPPPPTPAAAPAPVGQTKSVFEQRWDKLVAEAKKEGRVVIYMSPANAEIRPALADAFKKKYDIDLEFVVGRGAELVQKIQMERRAGLYMPDLGILGSSSFFEGVTPLNLTIPLEPLIFHPEVLNPGAWFGGKLPYVDDERHGFALALLAMPSYIYNTDIVNPQEVQSTPDLLNPKWKGRIVLDDLSQSGNGNEWYTFQLNHLMGVDRGREFMRNLANNIGIFTRDHRQHAEWVARGKYAIGIGVSPAVPPEFEKSGAPIKFMDLKEPRPLATGWGLINGFKDAPHPSASQLFLNWLLTREGADVFVKGSNYPSPRLDADTQSIMPILRARPGDVFTSTREYNAVKQAAMKIGAEDFKVVFK
ncbi:MAG: extracellular solute-binding protein [Chloroflexi bacterium]|nr:extracellular solute-binding protein [Chloroflexota bacterium]